MSMLNRKSKRVNLVRAANVTIRDLTVEATTENVSLDGLFIRTDQHFPVGACGGVSFNISGSSQVTAGCVVVREEESGLALQFKSLDFNSFDQLKAVVKRKSSYPLNEYFCLSNHQHQSSRVKSA